MRPTAITLDRRQGLLIVPWNDGHESRYRFALLRAACPCAECNEYRRDPNPLKIAKAVSHDLQSIELVGGYALQMNWGDGHRFGIYPWPLLRDLCPCPQCRNTVPER